jgi:methyltransferase (TIGR00027 family)
MRTGEPSATAIAAAAFRAAHLHLFPAPRIHEDTFALRMIGVDDPDKLRAGMERLPMPELRRVSAYFALRHRFSEERLQSAVQRGVPQIVLLGAGLDTFALRHPEIPRHVLFVEVDHPASQQWKLSKLSSLGLDTPGVRYLPVDFATQDLETELRSVGVGAAPTFFAWLGVTQYIPKEASVATLALVVRHGATSEIVFDVIRPFDGLPPDEHAISEAARAAAVERGEPWVSYFTPESLELELRSIGFGSVTRLTPAAAAPYYLGQPGEVAPLSAWELISARV